MNLLRQSLLKVNIFPALVSKQQNTRLYSKIEAVFKTKPLGSRMTVQGWIKAKRKMKAVTFIDISDGSTSDKLQVALLRDVAPNLDVGASVRVEGTLQTFGNKDQLELVAEKLEIIGQCKHEDGYPFNPRKSYSMEYIRQYLDFRPRTNIFSSVLRVRSSAANEFRNHLANEGFCELNTPVLTSCDCEGAGEVFSVKPHNENLLRQMARKGISEEDTFFNTKAFLSVSGQMHLESAVRGLGHVYTFGPTFRAENSKSRLHLSEFYMLETEEILDNNNIETVLSTIEKMLREVTQSLLDKNLSDLEMIRNVQVNQRKVNSNVSEYEVEPLDLENVRKTFLPSCPYSIMTYKEAIEILSMCKEDFKVKPDHENGLAKEHELYLVKRNNNIPIFVVDWPSNLKAFYMKEIKNTSNVAALDLLVPVVGELCGGSVREDDVHVLSTKLNRLGLEEKMSWYLNMRKFGNVQTGGFGMGFERYLQCLLNIPNIKDVMPFPRWPHNCFM
ncbi:hypothetical protein ONE63_002113 [Megalurothrips usitatus]|uniref:asparagine--tRNA ligase n=1 Tax=Megalurothrips usitatus TaxID=439358 RepID=A0AAV7XAJ4_9NEOP|nr:hypothetical protein ONE63_002113 [Megalurothrips usitatus]